MLDLINHDDDPLAIGAGQCRQCIGERGIGAEAKLRQVKTQAATKRANVEFGQPGLGRQFADGPAFFFEFCPDGIGDEQGRILCLVSPQINVQNLGILLTKGRHQILSNKGRFARAPGRSQKQAAVHPQGFVQGRISVGLGQLIAVKKISTLRREEHGLGHHRPSRGITGIYS
ncbi:hypothetical protein [Aquabacterium sp.]|uniref:hypothetical protein n=1 Tax=Aquabacterium sp. TaxID=1872578 RepID=UPI0019926B71|nr:hypothetical protein [Aquabacterium sp.]MBC7700882.1 hypothetical protein [Aquabacterium sp.]